MDSKRHLRKLLYPLGVSHPFVNHHAQTNTCTHQPLRPLGLTRPNLGVLLMSTCPNLFGAPFSWFLSPHASPHAWASPLVC
jgi:hypothetical protein